MTRVSQWRGGRERSRHDDRGPTTRELEVAQRLSYGESAKVIARALRVSEHTIKTHARHLRRRLLAANTLHAVCECLRRGLID